LVLTDHPEQAEPGDVSGPKLRIKPSHFQDPADAWTFAGRVLDAIDRALPRAEVRMTPTDYPMCSRAWSLDVRHEQEWVEIMAWGQYADWVVRALGAEPRQQTALGAGFGLERIAALHYGIDDLRKLATARVS
jgi:phenylalanyl-tRNA synthetase alpha subunit